jgi:molybdate transport repressor ModE-like protein
MEFRHLAALAAVAREGSFVDAAFELGYVQSAVSQQIAHLEGIVGARLVDRRRGASPVALTEAGQLLLQHFEQIRAELECARTELDEVRSGRAGVLRVGACDAVATMLMPTVLRSLSRRLPDLEVRMECARSPEPLAEQVRDGELDLAFGELPLPIGPLSFEHLLDDPYVFIVPAGWSVAERERSLGPDGLAKLPLIATGDEVASDGVAQKLEESGLEPSYAAAADGEGAVQALVAAGVGGAVLPRMAVDFRDDRLAALDLDDVLPPRQIVICWRAEGPRSASVGAFIEAASQACGAGLHRLEPTPVADAA